MSSDRLVVEGLNAHYGKRHVLRDVSMRAGSGEIVALVGDNGAGKTTLLECIVGIVEPTSGEVRFEGQAVTSRPTYDRVRRGIAHVPGDRRLLPKLTVRENLRLAYIRARNQTPFDAAVTDALDQFPELSDRLGTKVGTLSGGQQQMVAIARGLVTDPELILLDEPLEGLAPDICDTIVDAVESMARDGITVVVVEHEFAYVRDVVDRQYVLERGRVQNETRERC